MVLVLTYKTIKIIYYLCSRYQSHPLLQVVVVTSVVEGLDPVDNFSFILFNLGLPPSQTTKN